MTPKQLYKLFIRDHWANFCWACGRDASQRPAGWWAEWRLERAHIVNKTRVEDVRAVVILDSMCHRVFHGDRIILDGCLEPRPPLYREHLIHLKRVFNRELYDREFLQAYCLGKLPHGHQLPLLYREEFQRRRHSVCSTFA